MINFSILLLPCLCLLIVYYLVSKNKSKANGIPKIYQFLNNYSILMELTYKHFWKPVFGFKYGPQLAYDLKYDVFNEFGSDILFFYSVDGCNIQVANAEFVKLITSNRQKYTKPIELYGVLNFFGKNVVTVEGQDWKRHRKLVGPSFSESNNKVVFDVTLNQTLGLMDHWEKVSERSSKGLVVYCAKDMIKLTLHVISGAAFGKLMTWDDAESVPKGHVMNYADSLEIVSNCVVTRIATPLFAYNFSEKLKKVDIAYNEFEKYISDLISLARENVKNDSNAADLLTQLVRSSEGGEDGILSASELSGNIFIILLAGHETTAHTLAFALSLLAIHKNVQQQLYESIIAVLGENCFPVYEDIVKLEFSLAVFNETLRLFPIVNTIPKKTVEDVTLIIDGKEISIKAETSINLNVPAIHRNPRYWDKPDEFLPERFMKKIVDHAFIPFSEGMRSCVGKRFAQIEGTLALSLMVQRYEIMLEKEDDAESALKAQPLLTLTPDTNVRLIFKRR